MKLGFQLFNAAMALGMTLVSLASAAKAIPSAPPLVPTPLPLAIIVYDLPDYKGHALTLNRATPDLKAVSFDNKVASLNIQGSGDWVLCEHKNYAGRCARVQSQAGNLKLQQLNGRVSSLYPVPSSTTPAGK